MDISALSSCRVAATEPMGADQAFPFPQMTKDSPTIREVFDAEESPLLRFAYGIVGQRETAEDLVQEVFLRLHQHWHEVQQPRAWLYRSVRNLALNHLRDNRKETPIVESFDPPSDLPMADELLCQFETMGSLRLLMAELPEEDHRLLHMKYFSNLSYQEISKRTGLSVGNVGYKLHHLLKKLADSLRNLGISSIEG
jgi:RNA polymerase sigma factor (sigma-70 family)